MLDHTVGRVDQDETQTLQDALDFERLPNFVQLETNQEKPADIPARRQSDVRRMRRIASLLDKVPSGYSPHNAAPADKPKTASAPEGVKRRSVIGDSVAEGVSVMAQRRSVI